VATVGFRNACKSLIGTPRFELGTPCTPCYGRYRRLDRSLNDPLHITRAGCIKIYTVPTQKKKAGKTVAVFHLTH
jgi:hypothetical protein